MVSSFVPVRFQLTRGGTLRPSLFALTLCPHSRPHSLPSLFALTLCPHSCPHSLTSLFALTLCPHAFPSLFALTLWAEATHVVKNRLFNDAVEATSRWYPLSTLWCYATARSHRRVILTIMVVCFHMFSILFLESRKSFWPSFQPVDHKFSKTSDPRLWIACLLRRRFRSTVVSNTGCNICLRCVHSFRWSATTYPRARTHFNADHPKKCTQP